MIQEWFEMKDIRKRWLANAVWIPLRASHKIEEVGRYGYVGYREEFYGAGTLAVSLDAKKEADKLGWIDIGIARSHGSIVDSDRYIPCDVYEHHSGKPTGIALVLEQRGNRKEHAQWHLHQDLVIALGLKREHAVWVGIHDGYTEVAHLLAGPDSSPYLLEVRAEYLRDYLCARNMALYVTSYRNRVEIVDDTTHITWNENPKKEASGGDRWEGHVSAIHEGGMPYGEEMAVFHVTRNDVDPEEDVPTFDFADDDSVTSKSWTKKYQGKKLYHVEGELWRNEWVDPGPHSVIVRGDKLPATVFFITDATGKKESEDTLIKGSRWLWFKPDVIMALAHRRGGSLNWYTRDTGNVRCSPDYNIHFGVNKLGLINVYAKDIGLLPEWQQRIWAGSNVSPEGKVSEELLAAQMRTAPADTQAPEAFLAKALAHLDHAFTDTLGEPLLREHQDHPEILTRAHRFRAVDQAGLFGLAKDLARLTADSIDTTAVQRVVSPPKGEKWASLKSLEKVLAKVIPADEARNLLSPLVGIYELRHADAHLAGSEIEEALTLAGVDSTLPPIQQGCQLIHACVSSLYKIAEVIKKSSGKVLA